jgi:hypothetical protein
VGIAGSNLPRSALRKHFRNMTNSVRTVIYFKRC